MYPLLFAIITRLFIYRNTLAPSLVSTVAGLFIYLQILHLIILREKERIYCRKELRPWRLENSGAGE